MESFFNTKGNRILGSLVLLMIIIALGAYATFAFKQVDVSVGPTTISVSGEGEVTAVPDIGEFSFSVVAEGDDASSAQEASGTKINAILDFLKEKGIEEKDIKTEFYNVNPKYRFEERPCPVGSFCPPGERVQDGFEVNQTVRVKVRNLDESSALITGVGDLGATNISSLQFTIDDPSNLKAEARTKAIADAKSKADKLAEELDVRLVRIVGYYENEGGFPPYYGLGGDEFAEKSVASFDGPSLPTGENTIKSQVSITYQVN